MTNLVVLQKEDLNDLLRQAGEDAAKRVIASPYVFSSKWPFYTPLIPQPPPPGPPGREVKHNG